MIATNQKMGIGVGIMLLKEGKILLGQRHPDPKKANSDLKGEGTWTMPGGKVDFGETIINAAIREVKEETNIDIKKDGIKIISISDDIKDNVHFVTIGFLCELFSGIPQVMEPEQITKWDWFDLSNLPKPIFFPSQKVLDNFLNKTLYSS
jgi:8-oxo-dGTP diphosphatase